MKFKFLTLASLIALLVVAGVLRCQLTAQTYQPQTPKHHHYKLIDMGMLGTESRIDDLAPLNNFSTVAGSADTPILNPYLRQRQPNFFPRPLHRACVSVERGRRDRLGFSSGRRCKSAELDQCSGACRGQRLQQHH